MPRTGGDSNKLGNRYEGWWTVNHLIDVLAGDAVALQPEAYDESAGVEFVKTLRNHTEEFHSVKRQRSGAGWTLSALTSLDGRGRSVLKDLFDKLDNGSHRAVVFVSTTVHGGAYEVWDRSRRCQTADEFKLQLKTDKGLYENFENYFLPLCNNDWAVALQRLHSLRLEPQGESELQRQVETNVRRLLYRADGYPIDSHAVVLKLADFIYDSLGRRLSEGDVRSALAKHGYHLRDWMRDPHISGQVHILNERYLRYVEADLILGQRIPRPEAAAIAQTLQGNGDKPAQLVVGAAGRGKSCVLAQIIRDIEKSGVPFLALRLDNIPSATSSRSLGRILELPDSPAIVLAGLSQGRRAVLVLDQLDAMSVVSGRNADLWQPFEELLQEVSQHPNLRLLLACRAFDLEYDPKLAQLVKEHGPAQRIDLALLPIETVKDVVRRGGGVPERLSTGELEILRTPFHLHLFLSGEPANPVSFGGRQELFTRFWNTKRQKASQKNVDFERVVGLLTDILSQNEGISAPANRLDAVAQAADVLASDNVLVKEGERYRFFHESFFDYAFARRFVREGRDLVNFLTTQCTEQHLFRRAQVRQVLAYQREDNRETYLATLSALLNHQAVRTHVKKLVLDWLAQLDNPCEGEWGIVEPLLKHPQLHWASFNVLWGKTPWFDLLNGMEVWPRLLSDADSSFVTRCVAAISQSENMKQRSSQMATLLRPYKGTGDVWLRRFRDIFSSGQFHLSQEMFNLVMELIAEGLFDHGDELRWYSMMEMAEQRPELAVVLLARVLERMIAQARQQGETNPFVRADRKHQITPEFIESTSQKSPRQFAEQIVPIIQQVVLSNAQPAKCGGYFDNVWHFISFGSEHDTHDALLGAAARALKQLASTDPQKCALVVMEWQKLEHKTLQFLLVSAWNGNPSYFAEIAADHFVSYPLTFLVGYDGGIGETDSFSDALSLLKAISPLVRPETLTKLEAAIHGYIAPYEKTEPAYRGYRELTLWRQLQTECLSKNAKARIKELEAKFPERKLSRSELRSEARWKKGGFVPPVISNIAFAKMTDEQFLRALRRYSSADRTVRSGKMGGRAEDIYSPIHEAAKSNRKKFAAIALKLPDDIAPSHFDAILWGLADNSNEVVKGGPEGSTDIEIQNEPLLPTELVLQVLQRVHRLPGKPCGRAICMVADMVAKSPVIPEELVSIVADYVINDANPEAEVWEAEAMGGKKYNGGNPLFAGINSCRGSAAGSFSKFLFAHPEMTNQLLPFVEALARDKSIAVRTVNVQGLMALLNTRRDKAVQLFIETCQAGEPLWATRPVEDFLYYGTISHYSALRPLLLQMLKAVEKNARHAAARQITLAAFRHLEAEEDMATVLNGDDECRRGAAEIYVHNVHNESVRDKCVVNLERLFNDPSKPVRDTAVRWFFRRSGVWTGWQRSLLAKYAESDAYVDGGMESHMNLKDTPEKLPDEVLRLAERTIELFDQELKKPSPDPFRFSHYLPGLVLRFYEQSKNDATRRKCLDLLDRMIVFGWGEASVELAKADRW